tara:strand:- start:3607 stop:4740 length:1134 start_codon:yes stop_codon:yes gene_type:complete
MRDGPGERLLDLIYDAATDSSLWPDAITAVADACGGAGGILFGMAIGERIVLFEHNGRLDDHCSAVYKTRHMVNDWSLHMETQPEGRIVLSDEIMPLSRFRRTAFYDEVLRPQTLAHNAMAALSRRENFQVAFNLVRTARQGPFVEQQLAVLRMLLPHIQRSLLLTHRFEGYRALQQGQQQALDGLSCGVVLLDRQRKVLHANRAALDVLRRPYGITTRAGVLACAQPGCRRHLEAAWQSVASGQPTASMCLAGENGSTLTLTLSSLRGRDLDRFSAMRIPMPAVLLYIVDSNAAPTLASERLQVAFGLSAAEARVALAAMDGDTIAEMGDQLGLSPNTVKTHLSRVFSKTGASRRSQLVRQLDAIAQVRWADAPPG